MKIAVDKMTPGQFIVFILFIGMAMGGGVSHLGVEVADNLMAPSEESQVVAQVNLLTESIDRLNKATEQLSQVISRQDDLINRTRCEVAAARNGTDWRNCWTPVP